MPLSLKSPLPSCAGGLAVLMACWVSGEAAETRAPDFSRDVQPLITKYCSDCHADGEKKGDVAFDELKVESGIPGSPELWFNVLKNLRAGLMPPAKKAQPTAEERAIVAEWIKTRAFGLDPAQPDPGHVTVRRLNRNEYRNTIRDLMGVDYRTEEEFPPDDTGHGFDNLGEVLTISPMLLEKYLRAARAIVEEAVPTVSGVPAQTVVPGRRFHRATEPTGSGEGALSLSYYESTEVFHSFSVPKAGRYQYVFQLTANEKFVDNVFDYNRCRLTIQADGQTLLSREFAREGDRAFRFEFDRDLAAGDHEWRVAVEPLTPDAKQVRSLSLRLQSVTLRGPLDPESWVKPPRYTQFFPRDTPSDPIPKRAYAAELLGDFASRAFRRPVDDATRDRLVQLAETTYQQPGKTFEAGIAQAMVAILASPRFLFREEGVEPAGPGSAYPWVDSYALASRLSYFLWSSMPDQELFRLAREGTLRKRLPAQLERMLKDPKSNALIQNFTGQWLQTRDIETVQIDARAVLSREEAVDPKIEAMRTRFRELRSKNEEALAPEEKAELAQLRAEISKAFGTVRVDLTGDLRRAMRRETEMVFEYILRENRPVSEFLEADYTFLNQRLATHYGLNDLNLVGDEMQRVSLPTNSPRGGILTQGTVLAVTSNPTRTSPVKRGVFVLENVLGTPPPPPPPNIPALEEAGKRVQDHTPTLRETLELHRNQPLCSSCHNRMDPLGLALENFNAMGMWRDQERQQPVDVTGRLITGESFQNVRELKHLLATQRLDDFYHCLTEKLLTYALGRGLDYRDVGTVDGIVARLQSEGGRPSALLLGIVESAPFQKTRGMDSPATPARSRSSGPRAELRNRP